MADTWATVVKQSLVEIGVLSPGEVLPDEERNDGLSRLRGMLGEWEMRGLLVPGIQSVGMDIATSKLEYTVGLASASPAPDLVLNQRIGTFQQLTYRRVGFDVSYVMKGVSYRVLSQQRDPRNNLPTVYFFDRGYPFNRVLFNRLPDVGDRFEIVFRGSFGEVQAADEITDVVPENFQEPIMLNLAVKLAPSYGVKDGRAQGLSRITVMGARAGINMIRKRNIGQAESQLDPALVNYGTSQLSGAYYETI